MRTDKDDEIELFLEDETVLDDLSLDITPKAPKIKTKKVNRNYMDPRELHKHLKEHVISRAINPEHVMTNALGLLIIKLVDEYSNSAKYRNYYNGWKYEMKSQAYEHICRYAHMYKIHYTDTVDFFVKWLFRDKDYVLEEWFNDRNLDYAKFKANLPEKLVKTPNGKEKTKIARVICADELDRQLNCDGFIIYNPNTFKSEFFTKRPEMVEEFAHQIAKNAFNYLTMFAYHAFIAVIKRENLKNEQQKSYDEKRKYDSEIFDEDGMQTIVENFSEYDESRIDWAGTLLD